MPLKTVSLSWIQGKKRRGGKGREGKEGGRGPRLYGESMVGPVM